VAAAGALAELVKSPLPTGADAVDGVALHRTALEGLGLALASLREASQGKTKDELRQLLERQLHADVLDLLVNDETGWAEHDRRLPLLQGASNWRLQPICPCWAMARALRCRCSLLPPCRRARAC
jgi:hypothetical protein